MKESLAVDSADPAAYPISIKAAAVSVQILHAALSAGFPAKF